jgi:O-antigen/teichoic acid export membrane protein
MSPEPDSASRSHAGRDVAIQIGARAVNLVLGVVVTVLLARALGDDGFGEWSTVLVVVQLAAYFTSFGVESVVIRETAAHPEREDEWLGALLILRALLSVPAVIVGLIVIFVIQDNDSMLVAGLVLLAQTPFNIGASLRVVHQMRVRNWFPMIVLTINSVLWAAAVIAIYVLDGGVVALAVAMTVIGAFTATLQAVAAVKIAKPHLRPSREATLRLARVGLPVGISGLLVLAYARIDQVLVFAIAGPGDAGLYGAEYRIVEQAHLVPISLMTTLLPILSSAWTSDRGRALRIAWLSADYLAVASLGGLAVALAVAEPITVLLYGEDFAAAAPALPVLGGAFVFICFGYLTGNLILIAGLQRRLITVGLVGLVFNVAGNFLLVPAWGFMGAAWMTLATEAAVVSFSAVILARAVGLGSPNLVRLGRIFAAAAILAVVLVGLDALGAPLAVVLVVAALAYPGLVVSVGGVSIAELKDLVRERGAAVAE